MYCDLFTCSIKKEIVLVLYRFCGWAFNLLNKYIPKSTGVTCISTFPDYDDMCRGILDEQDRKLIILLQNKYSLRPLWVPKNTKAVKKNSLVGLYYLLRSSKIYYTHGIFGFFKVIEEEKQLVINLWHGMPIKNIGYLDGKDIVSNFHYVLSSSLFFAGIISKAFGVEKNQVIVDILPRNKILLNISNNENLLILKERYNKLHVWLPTYRKSVVGDVRTDGNSSSIFGFDDLDLEVLNNTLKSDDSLLIIKPHPMAQQDSTNYKELSNILIINEGWLFSNGVTLYELLSVSNTLWTDFSSVFIDFILVSKPILFVIPDFNDYENNRGFTFPLERKMLPGPVIETATDLIDYLSIGNFNKPDNDITNIYLN